MQLKKRGGGGGSGNQVIVILRRKEKGKWREKKRITTIQTGFFCVSPNWVEDN